MTERTTLWTVTDPRGLSVSLAADVWEHIIYRRREMLPYFHVVHLAIEDPDEIYFDPDSTQQKAQGVWVEAYYQHRLFTGKWQTKIVFVSVKFVPEVDGVQGYVQSAMATGRIQTRMVPQWKRST